MMPGFPAGVQGVASHVTLHESLTAQYPISLRFLTEIHYALPDFYYQPQIDGEISKDR